MAEFQDPILKEATKPQFKLNLSERGELKLQGNPTETQLTNILDTAHQRQRLYQQHQESLVKEADKNALLLGVYVAGIIGLMLFVSFNLKPNQNFKSGGTYHAELTTP